MTGESDSERERCPWGCISGADVGAPDWAARYIAHAQPECPNHGTPRLDQVEPEDFDPA